MTGALSWWKCHWPDLKSAGLFRRNLFLNSLLNLNIVTLTLNLWPINSGVLTFFTPPTSLIIPNRLPAFLESLMPLKNWCSIYATCSKSSLKLFIRFCGIFPSLKHNFIAYHSFKVSDCIFEIHRLWQSGFSRVYSISCCRCSFVPEIIKIGQSSHKMYCNKIILNACIKKVWKGTSYIYMYIYIYMPMYIHTHSYIHIYVYTRIYAYIHMHTHLYIHTYIHTHIYIQTYIYTHIFRSTHIHIYIYIHTSTHTYIHTLTYICTHTHTHAHTHIYIYIYIYTQSYMHICTHAYTSQSMGGVECNHWFPPEWKDPLRVSWICHWTIRWWVQS